MQCENDVSLRAKPMNENTPAGQPLTIILPLKLIQVRTHADSLHTNCFFDEEKSH